MKVFNKEGGSFVEEGLMLLLEFVVCNLVICDEFFVIFNIKCDVRMFNLVIIDGVWVGFYLGIFIVLEDGRMFGILCVVDLDFY